MDTILNAFDRQFIALNDNSLALLASIKPDDLFRKPRNLGRSMAIFSCGEYLLRSAGVVEQTAGGITTRLWDDPFEWSLPEELSTIERVGEYLIEVEVTRARAFRSLGSDAALEKLIPAPDSLRSIFDVILLTFGKASQYQGRAFAVHQMLSDEKLPRL